MSKRPDPRSLLPPPAMNSIPLHSVHSLIHHDHNSRPYPPSNPIHLHQPSSSQPSFHNSQKRSLPPQQSPTEPAPRPTKRSRKAINCEPCRSSKLKCDRGRPCSGCVLRNTVSQCYSDAPGDVVEGNPGAPPSRPPIEDFRCVPSPCCGSLITNSPLRTVILELILVLSS